MKDKTTAQIAYELEMKQMRVDAWESKHSLLSESEMDFGMNDWYEEVLA